VVVKLLGGFMIIFNFSIIFSYVDINAGINVNADDSIPSFILNKRDGSFAEPVNKVLLRTNLSTITYTTLILLRTSISRILT
jgi:hypothetical protein